MQMLAPTTLMQQALEWHLGMFMSNLLSGDADFEHPPRPLPGHHSYPALPPWSWRPPNCPVLDKDNMHLKDMWAV